MKIQGSDVKKEMMEMAGQSIWCVYLRSSWSGLGYIDQLEACFAAEDEADRWLESNDPGEGQYGELFYAVEEVSAQTAIVNKLRQGAVYDHETVRLWVDDTCVACDKREVSAFAARQGKAPMILSYDHKAYLSALFQAIVDRRFV